MSRVRVRRNTNKRGFEATLSISVHENTLFGKLFYSFLHGVFQYFTFTVSVVVVERSRVSYLRERIGSEPASLQISVATDL